MFLSLALIPIALGIASCRKSRFPPGLDDELYDLEAMTLLPEDLPEGYVLLQEGGLDNEEFAVLFPTDAPDAKKRQLDALGRIGNYFVVFGWNEPVEHFGRPLSFTAQSTLYVDVAAALESLRTSCGLLVDDAARLEDFYVPGIADGAVGFSYSESQEVVGEAIELNVCFRTGRIVHAIAQSGLEGTQDIALSVRLAERMLDHVEVAFAAGEGGG